MTDITEAIATQAAEKRLKDLAIVHADYVTGDASVEALVDAFLPIALARTVTDLRAFIRSLLIEAVSLGETRYAVQEDQK